MKLNIENSKNILVTGHQGFIGSHLMEKLDNATGYDIKSGDDILDYLKLCLSSGGKDTIIHLAADLGLGKSSQQEMITTNIQGTADIGLMRFLGVNKIIFASSAAIYDPVTTYGISKVAGELLLKASGVKTLIILRLFNVYGKGGSSVINKFTKAKKENKPALIYGSGENTRDYVYIDDVVAAFKAAVADKREGIFTYDVGTGVEHSVNDVAKIVGGKYISQRPIAIEIKNSRADTINIYKDYKWKAKVSLKEGYEHTI